MDKSIIDTIYSLLIDWAEAWAPWLPLITWLIFGRRHKAATAPVVWYFLTAMGLGAAIDIIWKYNNFMPDWAKDNNLLYNLLSMARSIVFSVFFLQKLRGRFKLVYWAMLGLYACFVVYNYSVLATIFSYGSFGVSSESVLLLVAGILFLLQLLQNDDVVEYNHIPGFWFAMAVIVYSAANFSIFLIYSKLVEIESFWATYIWDAHNVFYVLFCLLASKGFYESKR